MKLSDSPASQGGVQPKRRSGLTYRAIEGQVIILNRESGCLHQLNATASFIWDCCDGHVQIAEIVDRLVGAYEVDRVTARKHVDDFLSQLCSAKLVEPY